MKITITNSNQTRLLPDVIEKCEGTVSIVLEDGESYPLNHSAGTLSIFRKLWECPDYYEVQLDCECVEDFRFFLELMFHGAEAQMEPRSAIA